MYEEEGIRLVPYPAQFAIPFFPKQIKEACTKDLRQRYDVVSYQQLLVKISFIKHIFADSTDV